MSGARSEARSKVVSDCMEQQSSGSSLPSLVASLLLTSLGAWARGGSLESKTVVPVSVARGLFEGEFTRGKEVIVVVVGRLSHPQPTSG